MFIDFRKPVRDLYSPFSYTCKICCKCCYDKAIQVNPYETMRLSEALNIGTTGFRERYLTGNFLKLDEKTGACIFLQDKGCSVYAHRPLACRLYPLGRIRFNDGKEFFPELIPHPECKGEYGEDSTVVQYLQAQETKPFIKAESAYRKLIAKMAEKAAADGNAQITDESASAGSDAQDWILDPDPVITSYCLWKRIAVPRIISAKLRIHIRALYAWAGGAWLIHSNQ